MNYLELDTIKMQLRETQKMYLEALNIIDKIKIKLTSDEKVTKKDIIKIINKGDEQYE